MVVTTLSHLDASRFSTSSERYEYDFCSALRRHANLEVVITSKRADWGTGNAGDTGILGMRDRGTLVGFRDVFGELQAGPDDVVLFWGYDSRLVGHLLACRHRYGFRLVDFLYDHFAPAVEQMPMPKGLAARAYFGIAERLITHVDGLILFNKQANKHVGFAGPCLTLNPCFPEHLSKASHAIRSREGQYTLTYTGTLSEYNSIRQILEAFRNLAGGGFELRIFGTGPLEAVVRETCSVYQGIHYGGLLSSDAIVSEQCSADLLLSIRSIGGIINDFAFPSKLLEYIAAGVPILSTDLGVTIDPLRGCLNVIPNNSVEAIESGIRRACRADSGRIIQQQRNMQNLVRDKRFQWSYNAELTASFFEALAR